MLGFLEVRLILVLFDLELQNKQGVKTMQKGMEIHFRGTDVARVGPPPMFRIVGPLELLRDGRPIGRLKITGGEIVFENISRRKIYKSGLPIE